MSLASRLTALVQAIGADVKKLYQIAPYAAVDTTALGDINVASAPATTAFDGPSSGWLTSRILLHAQTNPTQNGIWVYNGPGVAMTRASDSLKSKAGQKVYVRTGAVFGNTTFVSTKDVNGSGEQWGFLPEVDAAFAPCVVVVGSAVNAATPPVAAASGWGPYTPAIGDRILITSGPTPGIWIYQGGNTQMLRAPDDLGAANPRGKLVPVLNSSISSDVTLYMVYAPNAFFVKVADAGDDDLHNAYSSTAPQTGFAADTMLTGSVLALPKGRIKAGTKYRCRFNVVKTAAGVAAPTVIVRIGVNGSTADPASVTHTFSAQTAVVDEGEIEIELTFRSVSNPSSANVGSLARLLHRLGATGLGSAGVYQQSFVGASAININNSPQSIGLSVNGGAAASWSISLVHAELVNLA